MAKIIINFSAKQFWQRVLLKQSIFFMDVLFNGLRPLFTKHLTPGLTCGLCNPFNDWLESTNPTNHPADYIILGLTWELKTW